MTIPVSTVPAVYAYLVNAIETQLAEDANASSILFAIVDPGDGPDVPNEIVALGEVRRPTVMPTTFQGGGGQFWLTETYDIAGMVSAFTGSTDTDGATTIALAQIERAWQLLGYVETAVRLDPSLGDLVDLAYPTNTSQPQASWTEAPVGLLVEITFNVHVVELN